MEKIEEDLKPDIHFTIGVVVSNEYYYNRIRANDDLIGGKHIHVAKNDARKQV